MPLPSLSARRRLRGTRNCGKLRRLPPEGSSSSMPLSLLLSAFVAAFLYVVIPGPAFIALLGIGAGQGRGAGARFIVGHLAGDTLWTSLALIALVGAQLTQTLLDSHGHLVVLTTVGSLAALFVVISTPGVSQVFGCGLQKGHQEVYRGKKYDINLVPKIKVETIICEIPVDKVLDTAQRVLRTGNFGDGKIFITELTDAVRIRTGQHGPEAIMDIPGEKAEK